MKFIAVFLGLIGVVYAVVSDQIHLDNNTAYGYLEKYGIPEAIRIRKAEEELYNYRIVGGSPSWLGQFPWQAGLILGILDEPDPGVCGGSLISQNKVLTAAHCWYDGKQQVWAFTVVLGSELLFSGGTRIETSYIVVHPNWMPEATRNDIAVIYLPYPVATSEYIAPISLPSGLELIENFSGEIVFASGFGKIRDGETITQSKILSQVTLEVIDNEECRMYYPSVLLPSNICTRSSGGVGTCQGDSGGPLVLTRNNNKILIGVTSFVSSKGCQAGIPAAYTRVTSFIDFIERNM